MSFGERNDSKIPASMEVRTSTGKESDMVSGSRIQRRCAPTRTEAMWALFLISIGASWMWFTVTFPILASRHSPWFLSETIWDGCQVVKTEKQPVVQASEKPIPLQEHKVPRDPCRGYDGVLRIRSGDEGAAAGTIFFVYMINHLIYAEMHNLLPWVHLDETSHRVYDSQIHGKGSRALRMMRGDIPSNEDVHPLGPIPFTPEQLRKGERMDTFNVTGSGVWESYFEPVSEFSPLRNQTCWTNKPLYEIHYNQIVLGLHGGVDWGVRAWTYGIIKKEQKKEKLRDWYRPMRRRAAFIVRRYIKPKPWLQRAANGVNPLQPGQQCMAMHVRTTDKGRSGGRSVVELASYLPHAESFLKNYGVNSSTIFLATDSAQTLQTIKQEWPPEVVKRVRSQANAIRSNSTDPTFDMASHDRTNREVLVEIYAMAKCKYMVHGRSAVSEAVLYVNPEMREASVDLEDDSQLVEEV